MDTKSFGPYVKVLVCFTLLGLGLLVSIAVLPPAVVAQTGDTFIGWETDAGGDPIVEGQIIDDEFHTSTGVSITISAQDGTNAPVIFDSSDPTGGDFDLGSPNQTCPGGGPGVGVGGQVGTPGENCDPQNNVLIIPEDDTDDNGDGIIDVPPDDRAAGGTITFIFSEPINPRFVGLLDQEDPEQVTVFAYADIAGTTLLDTTGPMPLGNNSFQRVRLDITGVTGVRRLDFEFTGSGAITGLLFTTQPIERDYGDLPASYGIVTLPDAGRHIISDLFLGATVDAEPDGQPSELANGDDTDADGDDEDGVARTGIWNDGPNGGSIEVQVTGGEGCLSGWIDWENDGSFTEADDQILSMVPVNAGPNTLQFDVPAGTFANATTDLVFYARFRVVEDFDSDGFCSDETGMGLIGSVNGGEVEDYRWEFTPTAITLSSTSTASSLPTGSVTTLLVIGWFGIGAVGILALTRRRRS